MANTFKFGNGEWAVGKETALAYNDENNNFKPLPFTFDRGSSATVVNKDGLIETVGVDEPRIDFSNDSKGALLLEPTRTNNLLQSNQFDTTWYNSNSFETESEGGFGGLNYWTITKTAASGYIRQDLSVSGVSTLSVYAKSGSLNWIRMIATGSSTASTWFDLQNGVVGSADFGTESSSIESVGNGWYRCSITVDIGTINGVRFYPADDNNNVSGTSGTILIQSAQLEQGSYATSYIPTQGSVETRSAETCSQTPPDGVIGQTEGTLFVDAEIKGFKNDNTLISVHNGSFSEYIVISGNLVGKINAYIYDNGSQQAAIISPNYSLGRFKCALSYSLNSVSFYINGIEIGSDTSATMPTTNVLDLGSLSFFNAPLNGKINQSLVYNTALTDQELIALTT